MIRFLILLLFPLMAMANPESHYRDLWCAEWGGETEVRNYDATRVDCLLEDFAVEVDFAYKWAESLGQALLYSELTGRPPAVLLIVRPGDAYLVARWHNAANGSERKIRLFTIDY